MHICVYLCLSVFSVFSSLVCLFFFFFFFFNDTATTEIYTLSLHDALPILNPNLLFAGTEFGAFFTVDGGKKWIQRSEEHTSELQSHSDLVCRLLLEKKKKKKKKHSEISQHKKIRC